MTLRTENILLPCFITCKAIVLYDAGIAGSPDTYEQPFNSLDLTYFWYPNDKLTLKAKVHNLLDEAIELEQAGVVVFSEDPGMGISVNVKYEY